MSPLSQALLLKEARDSWCPDRPSPYTSAQKASLQNALPVRGADSQGCGRPWPCGEQEQLVWLG